MGHIIVDPDPLRDGRVLKHEAEDLLNLDCFPALGFCFIFGIDNKLLLLFLFVGHGLRVTERFGHAVLLLLARLHLCGRSPLNLCIGRLHVHLRTHLPVHVLLGLGHQLLQLCQLLGQLLIRIIFGLFQLVPVLVCGALGVD